MGAAQSNNEPNCWNDEREEDPWWPKFPNSAETTEVPSSDANPTTTPEISNSVAGYSRSLDSHEKLEIFKKHLEEKRVERQTLIKQKKLEMEQMRQELEHYKKENQMLKSQGKEISSISSHQELETENAELKQQVLDLSTKMEEMRDKNNRLQIEIASLQSDLQSLNKDVSGYSKQKEEYEKHISALKDIITISKKMILLREQEMKELRQKVKLIEASLTDREMQTMSNELRQEYERQLRNIRNLRTLYDERARLCRDEVKTAQDLLTDAQQKLNIETNKNTELEQRITELEEDVSKKYDDISNLESNLGLSKAECRGLKHEMTIINQLAAQFLLGFNKSPTPQEFDLDKLIKLLEENHDLLTDINVKDDSSDTTPALPRLLLDLVQESKTETASDTGQEPSGNAAEEIITNLPKVWKVLMELLSHQAVQPVEINAVESSAKDDPCYKTVETPSGTRYELSVSKTYIRLKDLIVEKKYLQKEMHKMKKLNGHLEERLQEQESRLHLVTKELSKTWHIVGRMQRQHEQLHTHEKILRYELSQKRKMLNELKEELELCKEKWVQAREKNTASEHACRKLRSEFARRKVIDDCGNNSAESGYSDEHEGLDSDDDEEPLENKVEENILETITEIGDPKEDPSISENNEASNCGESETIDRINDQMANSDTIQTEVKILPSGSENKVSEQAQIDVQIYHELEKPAETSVSTEVFDEKIEIQVSQAEDLEMSNSQTEMPVCVETSQTPTETSLSLLSSQESSDHQTEIHLEQSDPKETPFESIETAETSSSTQFFEEKAVRIEIQTFQAEDLELSNSLTARTVCVEVSQPETSTLLLTIEESPDEETNISEQEVSDLSNSETVVQTPIESNEVNFELNEKIRLAEEDLESSFKKLLKPQVISKIPTELPVIVPSTTSTVLPEGVKSIKEECIQDPPTADIPKETCTDLPTTSSKVLADAEEFARRREERFRRMEEYCVSIKNTYSKHIESVPSTSKVDDRIAESREDKFKRLEEQCSQLKEKYRSNSKRGTELCARLDAVHETLTENEEEPEEVPSTSELDLQIDDFSDEDQTTDL